jgi:hypothetical protein
MRPLNSVSLEGGGAYFIRTDTETLADGNIDAESDSRVLGGEAYGSAVWGPDPAFRFNAGGGVFFPGQAFRESAPRRWKLNLGLIISL